MAAAPSLNVLREMYLSESARIKQAFEAVGDGMAAIHARTELVDNLLMQTSEALVAASPGKVAVVAIGGYGRRNLFPFSDIDLMYLCATDGAKASSRDGIRRTSQDLWDLRLKLSPTTRTLNECDRLDPENIEFTIALMDARFLAGDEEVFRRLKHEVFPGLVRREWQSLVQLLVERTQTRHEKFGRTIFHLEPNIKEAPGGLRDFNVASWLALLDASDGSGGSVETRPELERAFEFHSAVRTFLHYRSGRDDNTLSWEAQDQAASRSIGMAEGNGTQAAQWMRSYFRNARAIDRVTIRLLQDVPGKKSSLYQQFQRWRGRVSHPDFSVAGGRVYLQQSARASDGEMVLRCFEFIAQHGLELASETETLLERHGEQAMAAQSAALKGQALSTILRAPHAANALRSMHGIGLLTLLVPEFQLIDARVVRDFYHRYTVDEHTFTAIDNLHRLSKRENEWDKKFAELLKETERPEILYFALLLHDLGKGLPTGDHAKSSVELAKKSLGELAIAEELQEEILFLIKSHLEMSAAMRRDIFDPENVRTFAAKVATPMRLRLLCLMTYADIRAVNPDALTPWKAENLWRLYVAANNQLNRGVDDDVIHATAENAQVQKLQVLIPNRARQLQTFLEGLPRRYLLSHTTDQIAVHFDMSLRLGREEAVVGLKLSANLYELSVVTTDRPFVFARVAGAMAAWGMNIVKANAFSNDAGVVVDSFFFKDRFRTLELNPSERERFKRSVSDVVSGKADLDQLLQRRGAEPTSVMKVSARITLDNESSSHSTLMEVVAQDRPGLLHLIASDISEHACNIELALIDTEGQTAIDVFYVTRNGKKLSSSMAKTLHKSLLKEISSQ
jgi:[protein-PII] uridylyltransferase